MFMSTKKLFENEYFTSLKTSKSGFHKIMSSMKPDLSYFVKIPVNILNLEMARITFRDRKLTKQANDANFYFLFFSDKILNMAYNKNKHK